MATYEYVEVNIDEARYLADLNGIQIDLQAAIDLCNYLLELYKNGKLDTKLIEPLSIAILMSPSGNGRKSLAFRRRL
jgi:hypothetical protein